MNCNDIQLRISAFVDGELDGGDVPAMFSHLSGCAACQGFLSDALRLRADLRAWEVRAPGEAPDRKGFALKRVERSGGAVRRLIAQKLEMPFAAAAGIALVLLGISLFSVSLWLGGAAERGRQPEVVYMLSLPQVEVHAARPADQKPVH